MEKLKYSTIKKIEPLNIETDYIYLSPKVCNMVKNDSITATELLLYIIICDINKKDISIDDVLTHNINEVCFKGKISMPTLRNSINNLVNNKLLTKEKISKTCYYNCKKIRTRCMIKIPRYSLYCLFQDDNTNIYAYKCYILLLYLISKKGEDNKINIKQEIMSQYMNISQSKISNYINYLNNINLINIIRNYEQGTKRVLFNTYEVLYVD